MNTIEALPWEDTLGVGGWITYVVGAILLLIGIVWIARQAFGYWFNTIKLIIYARRRGGKSLEHTWERFVGGGLLFILALLIWIFVSVILFQRVQIVRFTDQDLVLVYRWPWMNRDIPYVSIVDVKLMKDPSMLKLPGVRPPKGFPLKVVIRTRNGKYEINSGSSSWRDKATAIYNEIRKHCDRHARAASIR